MMLRLLMGVASRIVPYAYPSLFHQLQTYREGSASHCSSKAPESVTRVLGERLRAVIRHPIESQTFSIGLSSDDRAGHSMH
ncbi:hypothetical protein TNCV_1828771 [Trichonephila clavipes]|nr:hypothetical protein TNCV_1828771 [Trichonephila clavipes]